MKKKLIAIVILSVLLLSLTPCACAAGVSSFVTLDSCTAGSRIMLPIAPIAGDEQVIADYLPSGCTLSVRDGVLYLTGIPMYAGEETFSVNTSYGGLLCSMEVNAATPSVSVLDGDVTVMKGTVASISVAASTADAGTLYYQWYTKNGLAIDGACSGVFNIDTDFSGSGSYYCVVTTDRLRPGGAYHRDRGRACGGLGQQRLPPDGHAVQRGRQREYHGSEHPGEVC